MTDRWTALDLEGELLTRRQMIAYGRRFARAGRGAWYSFAIEVVWQFLVQTTRFRVRGSGNIPKTGGVLVASNHLSFADPTTLTAFCLAAGRVPRYLAKASLWNLPVVRSVMRSGRHIPVYRGAATASEAFRDAVASVKAGECVAIFPEATFSKDPAGWPMRGKTGVARIALETGAPVIPVANWGTHRLLPATAWFPRGLPRKTVELVAGPPVDLSDLAGRELTRAVLEEATARIMAAVTDLLATLRGERPPVAA
ncbi:MULTISPECIES: 1-acyl-sn-glycerol-3-phosphate acyltransferase [unclassified Amycolatopsis]|uniref:lysophospholipid acyltransferase family protein n=1 Tax=unclassified Amycolatopsis TaxID=2618356 RepID=UPI001FF3B9EA|nr:MULTISPECIES: lysophospholipid acyltransferase family protein [unclassified Amycolatopsis]UOZ06742.1 1-acyl-sn-glycerol-3-phosphate acyltransferase [Amycolatopsis sp. WQ 127309]WSK83230.1 1-acyl-sn-glycerol-3-phosphate acyltransferase [Amycolatopsis sp. NBC_01286]